MKFMLTMLAVTFAAATTFGSTLILEGTYQLRNIYVLNPVSGSGVGNCVTEVWVNDKIAPDELSPSAFEIDLSIYGLQLGDPVVVRIEHRDGCTPKILNGGALKPSATFEISDISISENAVLSWTTTNESGQLPYIVQHKKWNKWVFVGEVMGTGVPTVSSYKFQVAPVSGTNYFRVIQKDFDGKIRRSPTVEFVSKQPPVTFQYQKKDDLLVFSSATSYEIYDVYGRLVKRGRDSKVPLQQLAKGTYYLTFDNSSEEFQKR